MAVFQTGNSSDLSRLEALPRLVAATSAVVRSTRSTAAPRIDTDPQARAVLDAGYSALNPEYRAALLDPLGRLLDDYAGRYDDLVSQLAPAPTRGPWTDWFAAIEQHSGGVHPAATLAFERMVADLYGDFVTDASDRGAPRPRGSCVTPLVKWGSPELGPYTYPVDALVAGLGIGVAVVSLPVAFADNVALWLPLGHEAVGHDVLAATPELLDELRGKLVTAATAATLEGSVATDNGSTPLTAFATEYWPARCAELAADVCGVLSLGPAHAVGLLALLAPLRGGKLQTSATARDLHPVDVSRLWVAGAVLGALPGLAPARVQTWRQSLERATAQFTADAEPPVVRITGGPDGDQVIGVDAFRRTAELAAQVVAVSALDSLGGRSLRSICAWADEDEAIVSANTAPASPRHAVAAAVLSMCRADADPAAIHSATIETLANGSPVDTQSSRAAATPLPLPKRPSPRRLFDR